MSWKHYELSAKWKGAGALVFGRRVDVGARELDDIYQGHYENDSIAFSISVWPVGPTAEGLVPALIGAGDLYHQDDDGQDRDGKFATYPTKVLRSEQAGSVDLFGSPDERFETRDTESRWFLVAGRGAKSHALYYGVLVKPGQVPAALPPGLETFRAIAPNGRAHPRAVVGVRLATTSSLVPFDPTDARIKAAESALRKVLPKSKDLGFVVVPRQESASDVAPANVVSAPPTPRASSPVEAAFLARLQERFGPIESDEVSYFSGSMRGVVQRLDASPSDVLEAWYDLPEHFAFGDRAARYERWHQGSATLVVLEIDLIDGGSVHRTLGLLEDGPRALLMIFEELDPRAAKELLGLSSDAAPERGELTLGHG